MKFKKLLNIGIFSGISILIILNFKYNVFNINENNLLTSTISSKSNNRNYKEITDHDDEITDTDRCILSLIHIFNLMKYLIRNNLKNDYYHLDLRENPILTTILTEKCRDIIHLGQENISMRKYQKECFDKALKLNYVDKNNLPVILKWLKESFEEQNLRLILMFGSLIGAERYFGMIPYDDDIDFVIFESEKKRVRHLLLRLAALQFYKIFFSVFHKNMWQIGILCQDELCKIYINLHIATENKSGFKTFWPLNGNYINTWEEVDFSNSLIYPLKPKLFLGLIFKGPNNFTEFMKQQYGTEIDICYYANHLNRTNCPKRRIKCDLLKYRYPYTIKSRFDEVFVEILVHRNEILNIFIVGD